MAASSSSRRRIRCGLFDVDLDSRELHKDGRRVPVQEQPFQLLALLLERPGEIVTREQLRSQVWPADTYVSFDEGLNTAIRKLRIAFGDSAENPRFIETIPRRGYRFIAPVIATGEDNGQAHVKPAPTLPVSVQLQEEPAAAIAAKPTVVPKRRTGLVIAIASVSVFALVAAVAITYTVRRRFGRPPASHQRVMLAILPFQNYNVDPDQEYFADGLTEETITDLGQISPDGLGVIARTSAMAYKHTNKTIAQIGRELGVDYILEGSVRREEGKARISAQLIRVNDQTHLWARNYQVKLGDLLQMQTQLGTDIAREVEVNIAPQPADAARNRSVDPEAYDSYLKGRFYWSQRNRNLIKKSIDEFSLAIAKDPSFALAYAGLATAYNFSNIDGVYSPKYSLPRAKAAALKALELDPSLAEAHAALGMEKSHYEFDFPGAQREFLKAIELNPNSAYAHLFYSNCYLMPMRKTAQAIAENKKALELDPLSLPINNFMAMTYTFAGDYGKADEQFRHTIAMDPTFALAHAYYAWFLELNGKYEESIRENERGEILFGSKPEEASAEAAEMLRAFRMGGEKGFWEKTLELTLKKFSGPKANEPADALATAYMLAGYSDKAFQWLDKAYEERDGQDITLIGSDPGWSKLHSDPRFGKFLQRMGLPKS
jgi:TolB-like protein/DNA-binding winged helix-turn-helix (wHTH) protein